MRDTLRGGDGDALMLLEVDLAGSRDANLVGETVACASGDGGMGAWSFPRREGVTAGDGVGLQRALAAVFEVAAGGAEDLRGPARVHEAGLTDLPVAEVVRCGTLPGLLIEQYLELRGDIHAIVVDNCGIESWARVPKIRGVILERLIYRFHSTHTLSVVDSGGFCGNEQPGEIKKCRSKKRSSSIAQSRSLVTRDF